MIPKIKIQDNFNQDYRVVIEDSVIDVWLDGLFNKDAFTFNLLTGLSFVKVTEYHYKVTCDVIGHSTIRMRLISKDKFNTKTVFSNTLIIIVPGIVPPPNPL